MKKLYSLLLAMAIAFGAVNAQMLDGSNCGQAKEIPSIPDSCAVNDHQLNAGDMEQWHHIIPEHPEVVLRVKPPQAGGVTEAHIHKEKLYKGGCGGLVLVEERDIAMNQSLEITRTDMVVNDDYFIKLERDPNCGQCQAQAQAFYGLCVQRNNQPNTCANPNSLVSGATCVINSQNLFSSVCTPPNCEYVGNGDFESTYPYYTIDCVGNNGSDDFITNCWYRAFSYSYNGYNSYTTTDYYNTTVYPYSCHPITPSPRTGVAHIGFALKGPDYREYASTVTATLIAGRYYLVSFYIKRYIGSIPTEFGFGLQKLTSPSNVVAYYGQTIGNVSGYIKISTVVTVPNTSQYKLNIGSWDTNNLGDPGQYFFVDDISIIETYLMSVTPNNYCQGSTAPVTLSATTSGFNYTWDANPSTAGLPASGSNIVLNPPPQTNTTITVTGTKSDGCSHSESTTINVVPFTAPTISSFSNTICQGSNVLLSVNGTYDSYQWKLNGISISGATSNSYSASQTGQYSCTVTINAGCFATSNIITLTVVSSPIVTLTSFKNECGSLKDGNASVTVSSGTAPYNYYWSDGQNTATATGLSTGTYTILVLDANGCSNTATVIITSNPLPNSLIITNANVTCDAQNNNFQIGNYDPNSYYTWSTSTASVISNPHGQNTTITFADFSLESTVILTTTNINGCIQSTSMFLEKCCFGDITLTNSNPTEILNNYSQYSYIQNNTIVFQPPTNFTIAINGVFTIDNLYQFKIIDADIIFAPNARIETVNRFDIGNCYLHQCSGKMWDGIHIIGGIVNIFSASIIEDAENAIVMETNGFILIDNSTLNKNYKNIILQYAFASGAGPLFITNTDFNCDGFLLPPHPANTRTYSGIEIANTYTINVGDYSNPAYMNSFTNMDYGILIRRFQNNSMIPMPSIVNVFNNSFENVTNGIISYGDQLNDKLRVNIGGAGAKKNYFNNCKYSIGATLLQNIYINNNTITNSFANGITLQGIGQNSIIHVKNNSITNSYINGIHLQSIGQNSIVQIMNNALNNFGNTGILCEDVFKTNIKINSNNLIQGIPAPPFDLNITNSTGIGINNIMGYFSPSTAIAKEIKDNSILNTRTGINIILASKTNIVNNTIALLPNNTDVLSTPVGNPYVGIKILGSSICQAAGNTIQRGLNNNSNFIPTNQGTVPRLIGIHVYSGQQNAIRNNTIKRFGAGIRMEFVVTNSEMYCNTMERCHRGIDLAIATMSNQGLAGVPTDNSWLLPVGANKIEGSTTNTSPPINWYYKNVGNYSVFPKSIPQGSPAFLTTNGSGCGSNGNSGKVQERENLFGPIVRNERQFNLFQQDNKYAEKQYAYKTLKAESLLQLGTPDDTTFQNFYNIAEQENIGKINKIHEAIADGDFVLAASENMSLVPENQQEQNAKSLHEVYLQTWAQGNKQLDIIQAAVLENIACQEPITGGESVFGARVMLGLDFACPNPTPRLGNNGEENKNEWSEMIVKEKAIISKIYPNPNDGTMQLDYLLNQEQEGTLEIIDISGNLVYRHKLMPENSAVIISGEKLSSGIYLYRISINGEMVHKEKLVIIK